jgi:hypothetical protein
MVDKTIERKEQMASVQSFWSDQVPEQMITKREARAKA